MLFRSRRLPSNHKNTRRSAQICNRIPQIPAKQRPSPFRLRRNTRNRPVQKKSPNDALRITRSNPRRKHRRISRNALHEHAGGKSRIREIPRIKIKKPNNLKTKKEKRSTKSLIHQLPIRKTFKKIRSQNLAAAEGTLYSNEDCYWLLRAKACLNGI